MSKPLFDEERTKRATEMRESGMTWDQIGRAFGCDKNTVHRAVDPTFDAHRRARDKAKPSRSKRVNRMPDLQAKTRRQAEKMMLEIPRDTRGTTQRLLGDPLPGRSALDKKSQAKSDSRVSTPEPVN